MQPTEGETGEHLAIRVSAGPSYVSSVSESRQGMGETPVVVLGAAFADALMAASAWHRDQGRKGSRLPYLGHLLSVASIVIQAGGSETLAIAALLHDAAEDQPDLSGGIEGIENRFGREVAAIVRECSDSGPSEPSKRDSTNWRDRKQSYLDALPHKSPDALLVSLADKVDNARSIRLDLGEHGLDIWDRFNAPRKDQLWYYRELADAFTIQLPGQLADELELEVSEIERLDGAGQPDREPSVPKDYLAPAVVSSLRTLRVLESVKDRRQFYIAVIKDGTYILRSTKRSSHLGDLEVSVTSEELSRAYRLHVPVISNAAMKIKVKPLAKPKGKTAAKTKVKSKTAGQSKPKAKSKPRGTATRAPKGRGRVTLIG